MVKKTRSGDAPRVAAALSALKLRASRTGWTERTLKGSVTNMMAKVTPIHVPVTLIFKGECGP